MDLFPSCTKKPNPIKINILRAVIRGLHLNDNSEVVAWYCKWCWHWNCSERWSWFSSEQFDGLGGVGVYLTHSPEEIHTLRFDRVTGEMNKDS